MNNVASVQEPSASLLGEPDNSNAIGADEISKPSHFGPHLYYATTSDHAVEINQGLPPLEADNGPSLSRYEFWPAWFFYVPVIFQCLYLGVRYRDLRLPLIANPGIELSGLVGESKHAVLNLAGATAQRWIAPYILIEPKRGSAEQALAAIQSALLRNNLDFPLVAKPDIGCRGAGVRLIENQQQLRDYAQLFPRDQRYLLQQKAPYSAEAGVFYTRHPGEKSGQIISIALKYTPFVVGDGVSTLRQLIERDDRAGRVQQLYLPRHQQRLNDIIPAGKKFPLSFSGSHCRGSIFRNGNYLITDTLTQRLDEITQDIPGFYYGRLDIKFRDLDSLRAGDDLCILEINGASSEAAHIWDRNTPLKEIFTTLLKQYRTLYVFGHYHRQQGHKPPSITSILKAWRKERSLVVDYPSTD